MYRRIEFLDKFYDVTDYGRSHQHLIRIGDDDPQPATLETVDSGDRLIQMSEQRAKIKICVKGEFSYIRAFGQTFSLRIVNPVEQAGLSVKKSSGNARAPMPGVVVDTHVSEGENIAKGMSMMTIESMKILTAIPAPRHGIVDKIHFEPGQPFEKGAILVSLCPEEK